jgi:hypothetical protein
MRIASWVVPALLLAGCAGAKEPPAGPGNAPAKAASVEYRSAFDGYQPFSDPVLGDWGKANAEVVR